MPAGSENVELVGPSGALLQLAGSGDGVTGRFAGGGVSVEGRLVGGADLAGSTEVDLDFAGRPLLFGGGGSVPVSMIEA